MAITFIQEKKKQRFLFLILALVIFAIFFVLRFGFFAKEPSSLVLPSQVYLMPKVQIDWEVLNDSRLGELQTFEKISPFEGEIGRKNPFIPY